MFMVPVTMRDFFFEDPHFRSTWHDYDRLRQLMFQQPRTVWKRFDDDFRQVACMANNIMVDWEQRQDLLRLERERTRRTVPIQRKEPASAAVEGGAPSPPEKAEKPGVVAAEPMETEAATPPPEVGEKTAAEKTPEVPARERRSSRERRLAEEDPLARWERSWMFPRRWMLPSFKADEQLIRDLGLFREKDGDVVRLRDDRDALEVTFDMAQYRPDELRVSVQGGVLCVEGRHVEGEEGSRKQVVKQFLRRFRMPGGSRAEDVASNLSSDGVLVVTVTKPEEVQEIHQISHQK